MLSTSTTDWQVRDEGRGHPVPTLGSRASGLRLRLHRGVVVTLRIVGPPRTKKNSMMMAHGRLMQSRQAMEWQDKAVLQLQSQTRGIIPCQDPCNLTARIYRDKNHGDLGNYLAAICDALEKAGVVVNDKWIQGFDGSRLHVDRKNPRVELELTAL